MCDRDYVFIWDDFEGGNVGHLADHGITPEEAEEVITTAGGDQFDASESSGRPMGFGYTRQGRFLAIVFEIETPNLIYVVTAYETEP